MAFWTKRNTQPKITSSAPAFDYEVGTSVAYTVPSGNVYFGTIVETDVELQWVRVEYISKGRVYRIWDTVDTCDTWEHLLSNAGVALAEVA